MSHLVIGRAAFALASHHVVPTVAFGVTAAGTGADAPRAAASGRSRVGMRYGRPVGDGTLPVFGVPPRRRCSRSGPRPQRDAEPDVPGAHTREPAQGRPTIDVRPKQSTRDRRLGGGRRQRDGRSARAARGRPAAWRLTLERLLDETEDNLDAVRQLQGPERDQVVADFEEELARLEAAYDLLTHAAGPGGRDRRRRPGRRGPAAGVVVGRAGRGLGRRPRHGAGQQRRAGRPARGDRRPGARLEPAPGRAAAVGRPRRGPGHPGAGVARLAGRRRRRAGPRRRRGERGVARPGRGRGRAARRPGRRRADPARRQAAAGPVPRPRRAVAAGARRRGRARPAGRGHARPGRRPGRRPTPAPPPSTCSAPSSTPSSARPPAGSSCRRRRPPPTPRPRGRRGVHHPARRLDVRGAGRRRRRGLQAARPLGQARSTGPARTRLVVQLDPPDSGNAWFLSVLGPGADGDAAADRARARPTARRTKPLADELARLERILPVLLRPGALRRGQVYLSQDEAWELMTVTGAVARGRRLRRAGAGAVATQADARAAAVHRARRRHRGRRPPAEQRALVGGVRRRRARPRPRSPGSPPRPVRSCGPAAGGSSSTRST